MPGVIIRKNALQIDLRAHGYGKEPLLMSPTPANVRYAERLRLEILGKIERGTFVLAEYFPDSPRVPKVEPSAEATAGVKHTLGDVFQEWLKIKRPEIQHSTADQYQQTLDSYHFDTVRKMDASQLTFRELKILLAGLPENSKTFNNVASVLSMALEYGHLAKMIPEALHVHIAMRKHQKPQPDPFTLDQVEVLLQRFSSAQGRDYYEFAIFTGMRPSEQIALSWSKVDLHAGTVLVDEALTRGKIKGTKTTDIRELELTARARQVLERQRAVSQLAGGRVFVGEDGAAFSSTDDPLRLWWKPAMKLSGLRQRDARQTRHTFATVCLMAGITPAWAARQLGHSVEMFYRVYSRWIDRADKGAERRKLDGYISAKPGDMGSKLG
ncbi:MULTISPECIES: site-specific integrase [unclassified Acidovorax]|uniref:site-specific integrase n=1 Tax=unclassified Acidovorax TaxID=2684926 RepID=UPI001C479440|nr:MULTISPECIES: site-specific integrase [unclassified Acidovorax]MBV7428093.1 site-specific integrase [Acidovorax sp. sif0732]MBV7449350.1 site-specific integrase [Acidovorax sp. sif0715]